MNIKIRKAKERDAEIIAEIASEEWVEIYNGYKALLGDDIYSEVYKNPLKEKAEAVKNAVLTGNAFVAEIDGVIGAFATFSINCRTGTLSNNAVSVKYRGVGIAQMLYNSVFEEMKKLGVEVVKVSTGLDDAHRSARKAYEKAGFKVGLPQIIYYKKL